MVKASTATETETKQPRMTKGHCSTCERTFTWKESAKQKLSETKCPYDKQQLQRVTNCTAELVQLEDAKRDADRLSLEAAEREASEQRQLEERKKAEKEAARLKKDEVAREKKQTRERQQQEKAQAKKDKEAARAARENKPKCLSWWEHSDRIKQEYALAFDVSRNMVDIIRFFEKRETAVAVVRYEGANLPGVLRTTIELDKDVRDVRKQPLQQLIDAELFQIDKKRSTDSVSAYKFDLTKRKKAE